jgi:hypothetical protein
MLDISHLLKSNSYAKAILRVNVRRVKNIFKDTIVRTVDLIKHLNLYKRPLLTWLFQLVGDDTADEVWLGAP